MRVRDTVGVVASFVLVVTFFGVGTWAQQARAGVMCAGETATIVGTAENDVIRGTAKRDVIVTFEGDDRIDARRGNDLVCAGGGGDPSILGGAGDDILWGGGGNDQLGGGGGNDQLLGGTGDDWLTSGPGNDVADAGDGRDMIDEGLGDDTIRGGAGADDFVSYRSAAEGVTVDLSAGVATGAGSDTVDGVEGIWGSNHDDHLIGDAAPNAIYAYSGNDVLDSGGGGAWSCADPSDLWRDPSCVDMMGGGPGDDTIGGSSGLDLVFTMNGPPVTVDLAAQTATGEGNDTMSSVEGVFGYGTLIGDAHDNVFVMTQGGQTSIRGAGGRDLLVFLWGSVSVNLATGSATFGDDTFTVKGIEDVWGTPSTPDRPTSGNDVLVGSAAANRLLGFGGDDTISGGDGDDLLDGGAGTDTISGGGGMDTCRGGEVVSSCEL